MKSETGGEIAFIWTIVYWDFCGFYSIKPVLTRGENSPSEYGILTERRQAFQHTDHNPQRLVKEKLRLSLKQELMSTNCIGSRCLRHTLIACDLRKKF